MREVRLIDENGGQVGVVLVEQARQMARDRGVDLVEIAPLSKPPVCKLLDYGKFLYELKKKKRQSAKKHHVQVLKEIHLRPKTEKHDLETKMNHAREFLDHGDKVHFMMVFKGRENAHKEIGRAILEGIVKSLEDVAKAESSVRQEGNRMHLTLMPRPGRPKPAAPKAQAGSVEPGVEPAESVEPEEAGEPHAQDENGQSGA